MKDYRPIIKSILEGIQSEIDFKVKMAFPESTNEGNVISYFEITNTTTFIPTVDDIAFQVDIWCMGNLKALLTLAGLVDEAMRDVGFLRQYSSPDSMLHDPSGYLRKTFRFGRRVETLTDRLID